MKKKIKKNQIMITALALMIAIAGYMQFSGNYLNKEELAQTEDETDNAENMEEYTAELDIVTDEEEVVTMLDMDLSDINMENVTGTDSASANAGEDAAVSTTGTDTYVSSDDVVAQMEEGTSDEETASAPSPEEGTPGEAVYTSSAAQMSLSDAKLLKEQNRAQNKAGLLEIINNSQLAESAKQSAVEKLVTLTDVAERELAAEILLEAKGFTSAIVSISGETADVVLSSVDLTDAQRAQIEDIVTRKTGISSENIIISALVEN